MRHLARAILFLAGYYLKEVNKVNFIFSSPSYYYLLLTNLSESLSEDKIEKLSWLLEAKYLDSDSVQGPLVGTRKETLTPWSSNACDIFLDAGIDFVKRVERFYSAKTFDPMLEQLYPKLELNSLDLEHSKELSFDVDDILLNTIGGVLGYILFVVCSRIRRKRYVRKGKKGRR